MSSDPKPLDPFPRSDEEPREVSWLSADTTGVRRVEFPTAALVVKPLAPLLTGGVSAESEPAAVASPHQEQSGPPLEGSELADSVGETAPAEQQEQAAPAAEPAQLQASLVAEREALAEEREAVQRELAQLKEAKNQYVAAAIDLAEEAGRLSRLAAEELQEPMMTLAVAIAEAIVGSSVELEPQLHEAMLRRAVEILGAREGVRVRVSKETFAALAESERSTDLQVDGVDVKIVADELIEGFGCIAELGQAQVDARVGEQLSRVAEALIHERRLARAESES